MKIGNIRWSPSTEKILAVALEDRNLVILYRPGEDKHKASGSERHIIDEDGSSDSAITVKNNSEVKDKYNKVHYVAYRRPFLIQILSNSVGSDLPDFL